jgi:hypothetical protein
MESRAVLLIALAGLANCESKLPTTGPVPSASAKLADWGGFLSERLADGFLYVNDANANDSRAAFEAVVVPAPEASVLLEDRPGMSGFWEPSAAQTLELGQAIIDRVAHASPSYRYLVVGVTQGGARRLYATAACEPPAWWSSRLANCRLCRQHGSCTEGAEAMFRRHREDCSARFVYDPGTRVLQRL